MNDANPHLDIRLAGPDDAAVLVAMLRDFADFERLPNASTEETLRAELGAENGVLQALIVRIDGQPAGFATFFQTYSTFVARRGLYLEDIFVLETYRNRGVATGLLRHLARIAVDRKIGRVEFTVLLWNNIAIEFFEGLGATPNSAWTTYRLSGEWLEKLAQP